ncbi:MAG TPA: DnaJ domain-containing protein [Syntrophales bacterium]|nr:DnaJ domain-containing protein [Syntrophales bacterium]
MYKGHPHNPALTKVANNGRRCLSCGTTAISGRQRYCSAECRQRLQFKLDLRTGLIQALNAHYATFYFSDERIFMDVLPYGTRDTFRFFYPRSPGLKPAEDFNTMANILGEIWWLEKDRSHKDYLASYQVLRRALRSGAAVMAVKPVVKCAPSVGKAHLLHLNLDRAALTSPDLKRMIKTAYRQEAKKNHPDVGGKSETFRRIHEAYEELSGWADNPTYIRYRGFPDKWFYDRNRNRWNQPLPLTRA